MRTRREDSSATSTAITAVLVGVGCYLGASADTWLTFPGTGAGILFPPYAIVTAALLRSPPRTWWVFFLAAAAGDFVPHVRGGVTPTFALTSEVVNDLRAVVTAAGLLRFARRPFQFDTLRDAVSYLVFAVFLAPSLGAFAGAGMVVAQVPAHGFWLVWQEWMLSNATTALTLLPVLIIGFTPPAGVSSVSRRRRIEAALLLVGLLAVGACVFVGSSGRVGAHPGRLYWPLPFLLWAAVRFGPRGISLALLGVSSLSIWGALRQLGPFAGESPIDNLLELQFFLLVVSVPLLLLSALLLQQRTTALALEESRRQYQSVVEDQTEMICRYLRDGTYTFVNPAYAAFYGRAADRLLGDRIWAQVPAGVHRSLEELREAVTPASPVASRETKIAMADGEVRWLQWRDRAFFDDRGNITEYQSVGHDVTDRRLADEERRQLEAQRSVEAALREADHLKDEFISVLGHELRNPLTPIVLALEIMRRTPPANREAAWAIEAIGRQIHNLTRLVDDLLDISRLTLGKIQVQRSALDLTRVVTDAIEAARPLVDSFGHHLSVVLPDGPVPLRGDAARLAQIVANLIGYAAKYTEPGGHIHLSLRRQGNDVRLSVLDNGSGEASVALGEAGESERQTALVEREPAQGCFGIGLTLVRRLVEIHGGTVKTYSAGPDQGSEIVVRLPVAIDAVAEREAPAESPTEAADDASPPSLRILTVDDNPALAQALADILGMWGHTVRTAHDDRAALELAAAFAPDVVLLEPGVSGGGGLARRLREISPPVAMLLVSMSGAGPDQVQRLSAGASSESSFDHHLVKPIDVTTLRSVLDDCARRVQSSAARPA